MQRGYCLIYPPGNGLFPSFILLVKKTPREALSLSLRRSLGPPQVASNQIRNLSNTNRKNQAVLLG